MSCLKDTYEGLKRHYVLLLLVMSHCTYIVHVFMYMWYIFIYINYIFFIVILYLLLLFCFPLILCSSKI